jgi:hypothetical protein
MPDLHSVSLAPRVLAYVGLKSFYLRVHSLQF